MQEFIKKVGNKTKQFLKENLVQIIILAIFIFVVNIELPYYIEAPGGTINLSERLNKNYNKKDGSLNMLYVTQYRGNVVTVLLGKLINSWDLNEISNQQISNETANYLLNQTKKYIYIDIDKNIFVTNEYGEKINTVEKYFDNYSVVSVPVNENPDVKNTFYFEITTDKDGNAKCTEIINVDKKLR